MWVCSGFKFSQLETSKWSKNPKYGFTLTRAITEVVLNLVLGKFKVSMAKQAKDVVWNNAGIRHPTMKDSITPTFPVDLTPLST